MSGYAVIKKIGNREIRLEKVRYIHPIVLLISAISMVSVFIIGALRLSLFNDVMGYFGICLSGLVAIVVIVMTVGNSPTYKISINNSFPVYIPETSNKEADQKAICKASKDLEIKVLENQKHCRALQEIAERCK